MVLTARTGADPVVAMLDAGADDVLRISHSALERTGGPVAEAVAAKWQWSCRRRVCVAPLEGPHLLVAPGDAA